MAVLNVATVSRWLAPHCATPATPDTPSRYVRMRAGRQQKVAIQVWKRSPLDGLDPDAIAKEALARFDSVTMPDRAWLEILEIGGKGACDTLALGTGDDTGGDGMATLGEDATSDQLVAAVVGALVATNGQLAADIRAERDRCAAIGQKWVEAVADNASNAALLAYIDKYGVPGTQQDNQLMSDAVAGLLPVVGPAAALVLSQLADKMKSQPKPGPEEPAARWSRIIGEAEAAWTEAPAVLLGDVGLLLRLKQLGDQVGAAYAKAAA